MEPLSDIHQETFIEIIKDGLRTVCSQHRDLRKNMDLRIEPEYVITLGIALTIAQKLTSNFEVHLEHPTSQVTGRNVPLFLPKSARPAGKARLYESPKLFDRKHPDRRGKVDIAVLKGQTLWSIIEVKGPEFNKSQIEKDLVRIRQILNCGRHRGAGTCKHGYFVVNTETIKPKFLKGLATARIHKSMKRPTMVTERPSTSSPSPS